MAEEMEDLPPSYSNLGSDFREPTPAPEPEPDGPIPLAYSPPSLVFEDVYEACVNYVKKTCCYSSRFINQMKLLDVINKGVFYYKLESFTEKRESALKSTPYKGEEIDGLENGRPPDPWTVTVLPPDLFKDCSTKTMIPHTEYVHPCAICRSRGEITCHKCDGSGHSTCSRCSGTGRELFTHCSTCDGTGTRWCWTCFGTGQETCRSCQGYKKIKDCKMLTVTWKYYPSEFITDAGYMPNELIRDAEGIELYRKKDLSLEPITDAPDVSINTASARLLEDHKNNFPNEMIIRQRHVLRAIPFTRVTYQWKETDGEFYVYGTDRKVYFEDYPQRCCCCTCS